MKNGNPEHDFRLLLSALGAISIYIWDLMFDLGMYGQISLLKLLPMLPLGIAVLFSGFATDTFRKNCFLGCSLICLPVLVFILKLSPYSLPVWTLCLLTLALFASLIVLAVRLLEIKIDPIIEQSRRIDSNVAYACGIGLICAFSFIAYGLGSNHRFIPDKDFLTASKTFPRSINSKSD